MKDWVEWDGGNCPVPRGTLVEVKLRCGDTFTDIAGTRGGWPLDWSNENDERDIVAYRVSGEAS